MIKSILFLSLMLKSFCSAGQEDSVKAGEIYFVAVPSPANIKFFRAGCASHDDYSLARRSLVQYDSAMHAGYLASYGSVAEFQCVDRINPLLLQQLAVLLSSQEGTRKGVGILFGMEDRNGQFISLMYTFTKRSFKKFVKKANKVIVKSLGGEKNLVVYYNYRRYAKAYILANNGGHQLALYRIRK